MRMVRPCTPDGVRFGFVTGNFVRRAVAAVTRPARRAMHRRRRAASRRQDKRALAASELALLPDRRRGTRQAFIFEGTAVLVSQWRAPTDQPERGARIELRLLEDQPHRGSVVASQRLVIDEPRFRVDVFDRMDGPPGNLRSAHFHSSFDGVEPSNRVWTEQLRQEPSAWLAKTLSDLPGLLERSGGIPADATWLDADTNALRAAVPSIVAAVEDTLRIVRQDDP